MRARVTRIVKDKGIALPGVGLSNLNKIKLGQDIAPEYGGGQIADLRIDGNLILVYKTHDNGTPCKTFGKDSDGKTITGDGVAFPVHFVKSFVFEHIEDESLEIANARAKSAEEAAARLTTERDDLAKQVEQLTAPQKHGGQQKGR